MPFFQITRKFTGGALEGLKISEIVNYFVEPGTRVDQPCAGSSTYIVISCDEVSEMQALLWTNGYDPKNATRLAEEGIGPEELKVRLGNKPGSLGSLEYSHGIKKGGL